MGKINQQVIKAVKTCENIEKELHQKFFEKSTVNKGKTNGTNNKAKRKNIEKPVVGVCPWNRCEQFHSGILGLHQEIQQFYSYIVPTPIEHAVRLEVVSRIEAVIKSLWTDVEVEIFGSFRTGLYLPGSDIDLVVIGEFNQLPLRILERELVKRGIVEPRSIQVLDKATVPIIKLEDKETRLKVDIAFNMKTGIQTANLIKEYKIKYPVLAKLVFVLKLFLSDCGLNEVYRGGISSYSLILMIISFLQHSKESSLKNANLGVLLLNFLELYGRNFDYINTGISIKNGGRIVPKEELQRSMTNNTGHRNSILCIEDPLTLGNDVARSSFAANKVKLAFENAYITLCKAISSHDDCRKDSILGKIIRIRNEVIDQRAWIKNTISRRIAYEMFSSLNSSFISDDISESDLSEGSI